MTTRSKILLLPICGLGDAVSYLPYLKAVRASFPHAEIVVVVATSAAAAVLESHCSNVEIIVFNRAEQGQKWGALYRLFRDIRRRGFDMVISGAHANSVRVPIFAYLSGAKIRIGARSERFSFLYNRRADVSTSAHYEDRYRSLMLGAGVSIPRNASLPILYPPMEARAAALRIWREAGLGDAETVIGLVSGADNNARGHWQPYLKRWGNHGYAEVARWASEELGARVVMIGSNAESILAEKIAKISGVPVTNLCGKTGLGELQWIISMCSVVISNDTGAMHIAGALGTQVLALFGPTSHKAFRPPGEQISIIQGQAPCAPCYPHPTCKLKSCMAMDDISASQVIDGLSVLLNSKKSAAVSGD